MYTHVHTHIYYILNSISTLLPPHDYVPHAEAFGNDERTV